LVALRDAAGRLLGHGVTAVEPLGGGRNSRVYRLEEATGGRVVAKVYFRHAGDPRDRLGTEVAALRFLRGHAIDCVPSALAALPQAGLALYEHVDGRAVPAAEATEADVASLADFLLRLHALRHEPAAAALPPASEASFSLPALAGSLEGRVARLEGCRRPGRAYEELHAFLAGELRPALAEAVAWAEGLLRGAGLAPEADLPRDARTLSPSDFGLHNALRRPDGGLTFLDFEYFGWDDPAKTVVDVLLHPGMALSRELRGHFLGRLVRGLGPGHGLHARVRAAYALYALKWTAILLNEFVPEHLERRRFASGDLSPEAAQLRQLDKARRMLAAARAARVNFPYEAWMVA
jgi:hypothetical protein